MDKLGVADKLSVANTILAQLGGPRFVTMTGAKHLLGDDNSLSFKIPTANGINYCKITLDADDTYSVAFSYLGRAPKYTVTLVKEVSMVYADGLRTVFESATGLRTSL